MTNPALALKNDAQRASIAGIRELVPQDFYVMDYTADYFLDEVLAAGLKNADEMRRFGMAKFLNIPKTPAVKAPDFGCAAFSCRTPEGTPLMGRNYDIRHEEMTALLVKTSPEKGYKSFGIADLGWMGFGRGALSDGRTDLSGLALAPYLLMDGMNEKGFAMAVLSLTDTPARQDTGKTRITTTAAIRLCLDKAATTEEAVALLRQYDMQASSETNNYHFFLTDLSGDSRVVEYVDNEMDVIPADHVTNFYLSSRHGNNAAARAYLAGVAPIPDSKRNNYQRYRILDAVMSAYGDCLSAEDAMCTLRLAAQTPERARKSFTRWSEVFDLEHRTLAVAIARAYDNVFRFEL